MCIRPVGRMPLNTRARFALSPVSNMCSQSQVRHFERSEKSLSVALIVVLLCLPQKPKRDFSLRCAPFEMTGRGQPKEGTIFRLLPGICDIVPLHKNRQKQIPRYARDDSLRDALKRAPTCGGINRRYMQPRKPHRQECLCHANSNSRRSFASPVRREVRGR